MSDLSKLVESSSQLRMSTHGADFHIQRGLTQINEEARLRLTSTPQRAGQPQPPQQQQQRTEAQAHLMLAGRRFDASRLEATLESALAVRPDVAMVETGEEAVAAEENDVEGFLRAQHENVLALAVEQAKAELSDSCARHFARSTEEEWELARRDIIDSWASPTSAAAAAAATGPTPKRQAMSMTAAAPPVTEARVARYAAAVEALARMRTAKERGEPGSASQEPADVVLRKAVLDPCIREGAAIREPEDNWRAVGSMLDKSREPGAGPAAMVDGAREFLEVLYLEWVRRALAQNVDRASVGGEPTRATWMRAVLRLLHGVGPRSQWPANLILTADRQVPAWGLAFMLLRSGADSEALAVADHDLGNFGPHVRSFITGKRRLPDDRLRTEAAAECDNMLKQLQQQPVDQYRLAVLAIVSRTSGDSDAGLCQRLRGLNLVDTLHDWIWMRLSLLDPPAPAASGSASRLRALQDEIAAMEGQVQSPVLFFLTLLLTQQPERGIKFLWECGSPVYRADAVHLAIALDAAARLRVPASAAPAPAAAAVPASTTQGDMFVATPNGICVNMARLIRQYVIPFQQQNPRLALQYVCLVRDEAAMKECVRALILDTRDFEQLLGKPNGELRRLIAQDTIDTIVEAAARECEVMGRSEDAVWLYHLISKIEKVLELMNVQIGRVMALPAENPERRRIVERALQLHQQGGFSAGLSRRDKIVKDFYLLCHLVDFFDVHQAGKADEALRLLEDTEVVPLRRDVVLATRMADELVQHKPREVLQNLSEIMIAAMRCIRKLYDVLRSLPTVQQSDPTNQSRIKDLRERARALVMFAGMIQYKLPASTNSFLIQEEVMMS